MFPLPPDYRDLTAEGQRLARLNVLHTQETPEDVVRAWDFFDEVYLVPTPEGFFYDERSPTPAVHYEMIHDVAAHQMNVFAAPRGGGKTIAFIKYILLRMLTIPYHKILWGQAVEKLVERRMRQLRDQLERNELIQADFPDIRPSKNSGEWSLSFLRLSNGASVAGYSLEGAKRGERPHEIILDDLECDTSEGTDTVKVVRGLERELTRVFIPMLSGTRTSIHIVGTLISRKLFLYHMICGDDPKYASDLWNKKLWGAATLNDGNVAPDRKFTNLFWPERWTPDWLEKRKRVIGPAAFSSEMLNAPTSEEDRVLVLDPKLHSYVIDGEVDWEHPFRTQPTVKVRWWEDNPHGEPLEREMGFVEWLGSLYRFGTVDYAYTLGSLSDYSCVQMFGVDKNNVLWSLDLFHERVKDDALLEKIWDLAIRWRARVMGVEAVTIQKQLYERVQYDFGQRALVAGWTPHVIPIDNYKGADKAARIAALQWRFSQNKVKLPIQRSGKWPYSVLYQQISDFTLDLALLQHDDAIDTLAMINYVVRPKQGAEGAKLDGPRTPKEHIMAHDFDFRGTGLSPLSGMNAGDIDLETMRALTDAAYRYSRDEEMDAARQDGKDVTLW